MHSTKPVLIIQLHPIETPGRFAEYLEEKNIAYNVIHPYTGDKLPDPNDQSALISLGCPSSVSGCMDEDWSKRLFHYFEEMHSSETPFLGLCYSSQLLAASRGAAVTPVREKEIGVYEVTLNEDGLNDPLFAGFPETFPVFQWHSDMFDIPLGAALLASAKICAHQALRSGNNWGLQFHLEADPVKLPIWCNEYANELSDSGIDSKTVLAGFQKVEEETRRLCYLLLDNFFKQVK